MYTYHLDIVTLFSIFAIGVGTANAADCTPKSPNEYLTILASNSPWCGKWRNRKSGRSGRSGPICYTFHENKLVMDEKYTSQNKEHTDQITTEFTSNNTLQSKAKSTWKLKKNCKLEFKNTRRTSAVLVPQ